MADISSIAQKGHNAPPSDVEILSEQLTLRNVHLMRAAEGHVELAARIPDHFTEEGEATYVTDFIKTMQNCQKELERRRKDEKEPFLRHGQFVDSWFGEFHAKLTAALAKAQRPLNDWLTRKAQAEQAAREKDARELREQQEAAMRAAVVAPREERAEATQHAIVTAEVAKVAESIAAAPLTSMASSTGQSGAARLATKWVGTIKNIDELDVIKLRPYITAPELQKALDRFVRQGGRQCEGCEIKESMEVKIK